MAVSPSFRTGMRTLVSTSARGAESDVEVEEVEVQTLARTVAMTIELERMILESFNGSRRRPSPSKVLALGLQTLGEDQIDLQHSPDRVMPTSLSVDVHQGSKMRYRLALIN